ncbi:SpaA isopeptide-forming pilin-related protein [Arcanobacterium hippocoleae]
MWFEPPTPQNVSVVFSKVIAGLDTELAGASLKIVSGESVDGEIVKKWESGSEPKTFELAPGIYTLVEDKAPGGYQIAHPITFRVAHESAEELLEPKLEIKKDGKFELITGNTITMADVPIPQGELRTTVSADGKQASDKAPVNVSGIKATSVNGVEVKDKVTYSNFAADAEYIVTANLYEVSAGSIFGAPLATQRERKMTNSSGNGEWEINFGQVKNLEPGKTYVVYENATSVENVLDLDGDNIKETTQVAVHENPDDVSQTVVVQNIPGVKIPIMATTVSANGQTAGYYKPVTILAKDAAKPVRVTDSITYSGLEENEKYTVTGRLFEVKDGQAVGQPIKTKIEEKTAGKHGSGKWVIDFESIQLEPGKSYVVFETAVSINEVIDTNFDSIPDSRQYARHENAKAQSQTIVVEKPQVYAVKVSKVDIGGDPLAGADLEIRKDRADGELVKGWKSKTVDESVELLPGTYVLVETAAPEGFDKLESVFTFTVDSAGVVKVTSAVTNGEVRVDGGKLVVTNSPTKPAPKTVKVSKVDIGGDPLAGADLEIRKDRADGELVKGWKSKTVDESVELLPGTYVLVETAAPEGFDKLESVFTFTVDSAGVVKVTSAVTNGEVRVDGGKLVVTNSPTKPAPKTVKVSKVDIGGDPLAGADLEIRKDRADGELVKGWKSKTVDESVELLPGTYVLVETAAPEGFDKLESVFTFTVDSAGVVKVTSAVTNGEVRVDGGKLVVTNSPTKPAPKTVKVSKVDIGGDPLAGADLEIRKDRADGELVKGWKSKTVDESVELLPGTYVLVETAAPEGFDKLESVFTFTVDSAGVVKVTSAVTNGEVRVDGGKLVVTNSPTKPAPKTVKVSKVDIGGDPLAGADLEIRKDRADGELVKGWKSKTVDESVELLPGTYVLVETAAPEGFDKLESVFTFTVDSAGVVKVTSAVTNGEVRVDGGKLVVTNSPTKPAPKTVKVSKVDIGGDPVVGAQIQIKQDGRVVKAWESTDQVHQESLPAGAYVFHEESAPDGFLTVSDFNFTLGKDGSVKVTSAVTDGNAVVNPDGVLVVTDNKVPDPVLKVSKVDIGGDPVVGAQIQIKQDGRVVKAWESTDQVHQESLPAGAYVFHEESAPDGFLTVSDFNFTLGKDGSVKVTSAVTDGNAVVNPDGVLVVTDNKVPDPVLKVSKVDIGGDPVVGAQIQIKQDGRVVKAWESTDQVHQESLPAGAYVFHEESAPDGFLTVSDFNFTLGKDGSVKVTSAVTDGNAVVNPDGVLVVTDNKVPDPVLKVSKVDIGGDPVVGAQIQIKQDGRVVKAWESTDQVHQESLPAGAYVFHEESAPDGFLTVSDFNFTLGKDGSVKVTSAVTDGNAVVNPDGVLVVTDNKVPDPVLKVSKVDIGGDPVVGAQIQIKQDGRVVKAWESTDQVHQESLPAGAYVFHEESAPDGFLTVSDFNFTLGKDGSVKVTSAVTDGNAVVNPDGVLVVTDNKVPDPVLKVSKVDIGGDPVVGAQIQIKQDGRVVKAWESTDQVHQESLPAGAYVFHEESAPDGFLTVSDFNFTLGKDGSVKVTSAVTDGNAVVNPDGVLVVTDNKVPDPVLKVSKVDIGGDPVVGAQIQIKQDGRVVKAWESTDQVHQESLPAGAYVFHEESAPDGFLTVSDFNFTLGKDGSVKVTSAVTDGNAVVNPDGVLVVTDNKVPDPVLKVSKVDIGGDPLAGADLEIHKDRADGELVKAWKSKTVDESVELLPGTYVLVETAAPEGFDKLESVFTFTVDAAGVVKVTSAVTNGEVRVDGGKLVVTNSPTKPETPETPKPEDPEEPNSENPKDPETPSLDEMPKTGAQTAGLLGAAGMLSLLGVGVLVLRRRQRNA